MTFAFIAAEKAFKAAAITPLAAQDDGPKRSGMTASRLLESDGLPVH